VIEQHSMAMAINKKLRTLMDDVGRFAEQEIARRKDLHSMNGFPLDIWRKMGQEGLLGVSVPASYGGLGEHYLAMVITGETLVARGRNMGIALSWLIHSAVTHYLILGFGKKNQQDQYLERMAKGQLTGSIAVSEPGTGAHPKHLKTNAHLQGDAYLLNGEKAYLTNGPIADLFVVIALSGKDGPRKRFTAFLVPKDAPGLTVTQPMDLDFLRPSPHCGIKLENCSVPAENILGEKDYAYENMVKPFRVMEDVLMMGPVVGGMASQLELISDLVQKQKIPISPELKEDLGLLQSLIHCLRIMAYEASIMLDSHKGHPEFLSIQLASRYLSREAHSRLDRFITDSGIEVTNDLNQITHDIHHTIEIAKNVARIKLKKLGESLLSREKFYETES